MIAKNLNGKPFFLSFGIATKDEKSNGERIISGYASTSAKDRQGDVIEKSAFVKVVNEFKSGNGLSLFFDHNTSIGIGKIIDMGVDEKGLKIKCKISKAADVNDIWTKIKEGIYDKFSIGGRFKKVKIIRDDEGLVKEWRVLEFDLFEVSVVGVPANPEAGIGEVIEKALRRKEMSKDKTEQKETAEPNPQADEKIDVAMELKKISDKCDGFQKELDEMKKQEVKPEVKPDETKPEDKQEKMPFWAKKLFRRIKRLEKKSVSRKGLMVENEDEDDGQDEPDEGVKKALKDKDDPETVAFVKHVMENSDEYAKLTKEEKDKAMAIYSCLLLRKKGK
jgi:HK97 family phage prohead protease